MDRHIGLIEVVEDELNFERRVTTRIKEKAKIEIALKGDRYSAYPLIESTRHGARMVLPGGTKKDQCLQYSACFEGRLFKGKGRIAWTAPLSNGRAVCGIEFLTFNATAAA